MKGRPIEERDGTAARAAAPDGAEWVERHSADGHLFWIPPEVTSRIPEGGPWEVMMDRLEDALARRGAPKASRQTVNPRTRAACAAFAAYCYHEFGGENLGERKLSRLVAGYAAKYDLAGSDDLDPEGSAMRELAAAVILAIETVNRKKSSHRP